MYVCMLSCFSRIQLFATPWTLARQPPLSMEFSRQEYWSGLPCPLQGIFPTQGSNPCLLHLLHWQVDSLPLAPPGKPHKICIIYIYFPIENCIDYIQHIPSSFRCLWNCGLREVTTNNESEYIVDLTKAQLISPHFDSHTNYYYFC